jgi:hypothetical protein
MSACCPNDVTRTAGTGERAKGCAWGGAHRQLRWDDGRALRLEGSRASNLHERQHAEIRRPSNAKGLLERTIGGNGDPEAVAACCGVQWRATADEDGTTPSPWRYDVVVRHTVQSPERRLPSI